MRIQRFFVNPEQTDLSGPTVRLCEPGLINQARNVLRLKPNDRIQLLDGKGGLYTCRLLSLESKAITAEVLSKELAAGEPKIQICIALPLLKGGRFEWALEKLTELGVSLILPVIPQRAVVKLPTTGGDNYKQPAKVQNKLHHWQEILRESAEQCERAAIPRIVEPVDLKDLLSGARTPEGIEIKTKLICAERKNAPSISRLMDTPDMRNTPPPGVCVVVGPEGGLTDEELSLAQEHDWQLVSLGSRILRSETAAIYALAQIISVADK